MASAKLPLRKWYYNSSSLLKMIGKGDENLLYALEIGDLDAIKSLGLIWKLFSDEILKRTQLFKRTLLSDLNRVFHSLRFLTPVMIEGKVFLQQLWQSKTDWEASLSHNLKE